MKRYLALLLCAAMLITCAACGKEEPEVPEATAAETAVVTAAPTDEPTQAPTEAPTEALASVPDIIELVNNDDVAVHIINIEQNEHMGMQLRLQCENRTDRALLFSWDTVSVCGFMYDPVWHEEVSAGSTVNSTVYLDTYELEKMGVVSVDEISFTLNVVDSENWMEPALVQTAFTVYPTGLNADTVRFPAKDLADAQAVIGDDQIRFVIEWADAEDAEVFTVYVYLENNTERDLMYAWDAVTVSAQAVDSFWGAFVAAGKRACSEITFYRTDLEALGITDVSEISFTLLVSDYDDWEADYVLKEDYTYCP